MDDRNATGASAGAADQKLTRTAASEAAGPAGWRYLLGNLVASVQVDSLGQAATVAAVATAACADLADQHLRLDLRPDRVELSLVDRNGTAATGRDADLAVAITAALAGIGAAPAAPVTSHGRRPVQMLEIAIDAIDIAAIRPFWMAVLGYADEPGNSGPQEAIVDPAWELPAIWFQQMDARRPQRNRIHFDITVAHDEAEARVKAALAAGGTLVSDAEAPSFWVLADTEGNEACVCTWLGRDDRG